LATAIAHRPITVQPGAVEIAHTDGITIVVPEHHAHVALIGTVCIQAAMISAGALDAADLRRVVRNPEAARRFVTLEASRAGTVLADILPAEVLTELRAVRTLPPPPNSTESARLALRDRSIAAAPDHFGSLRRSPTYASAAGAPEQVTVREEVGEDEEQPSESDTPGESATKSLFLVAPPFENPLSKLMQSLFGRSSSTEDDDGGSDMGVHSAVPSAKEPSANARPITARPPRGTTRPPDVGDVAYAEWDHHAETYRRRWVSVSLFDPAPRPERQPVHHRPDRQLLNAILRIALSPERHNRQTVGDGLDVNALVDLQIARTHGEATDERVYQARRRTANDLSVLVLVDCSGSAAETSGGVPIWDHQRAIADDLISAFALSGTRVAAYGFSSRGRRVRFLRIKNFDDHFGRRTRERLWALEPSGFTRMGAAIRHANALLRTGAGTDRRLLVVISDGLPYDDDYEGKYAEQDTRRALDEAAGNGLGCACLAVDSPTGREALERMWGSATFVPISSEAPWAGRVEVALRSALRSAAAARQPR
jgi:hypothetical protein